MLKNKYGNLKPKAGSSMLQKRMNQKNQVCTSCTLNKHHALVVIDRYSMCISQDIKQ